MTTSSLPTPVANLWPWLWSWGCRAWSPGWSPGTGHCTAPSSGSPGGLWCLCHHTPPRSQTCTCSRLAGERGGGQGWAACEGAREAGPLAYPPRAPHLTSKFLLPVTGHPAPDALRLGPAGALAESHAAVLAAGGAGPPGPLGALAPRASLLHFVCNAGEQSSGPGLGLTLPGLRPPQPPAPAESPFFLATAEVSARRARRARRRKLRRCILRGEHGSESPPRRPPA